MWSIYRKEINAFFSSVMGYLVIAVFLILMGLFLWVFPEYSILDYNFATLDPLFAIAPFIFLFLIPAVTMRSFAEEKNTGTIEFLVTKPVTDTQIILGKYFANLSLVVIALLPTLLYVYTVYELGSPKGNLDTGAIIGSYIGLFFLCAVFVAIGILSSILSKNQIVAFLLGAFLCFLFQWAFGYLAQMPFFTGEAELFIQKLGINYHYSSISKGAIQTKDLVYFLSITGMFLYLSKFIFSNQR
ncbi:MAG TPA: gliding motility-associated ABC transporter permease subunit GldF [Saprospiraceae bacterium]|nr:gliding motility-associated ABC transporter permease subunit GldF [Saprospiraceae bacterium]HRX28586.1 gliding motility-associated ABC transporter permease subunit GldF [Saprospiraceae bacterium]